MYNPHAFGERNNSPRIRKQEVGSPLSDSNELVAFTLFSLEESLGQRETEKRETERERGRKRGREGGRERDSSPLLKAAVRPPRGSIQPSGYFDCAPCNAHTRTGALHLAADLGHETVTEQLVAACCNVNLQAQILHRACREITKPLVHENMPIQACTLAHWAHPTRHGLFHTRATIPCLFASFHSKLHIQSTMLLQRSSQHSTMQSFGTFLRKHIKDKSTWIGYPKSLLACMRP
jgi:hypothetical protein